MPHAPASLAAIIAAAGLALCAICCNRPEGSAAGFVGDDPLAQAAYNDGIAFLQAGRPAEAEGRLAEAARLAPGDAFAHYHLGVARYEQTVVTLGGINIDQEGLTGAIECFDTALSLDPLHPSFHLYRGLAAVRDHDWQVALVHFREAVRLDETLVRARVQLGKALVHTGSVQEALVELMRATVDAPGMAAAHHQLGLAALEAGEWALASQAFEQATLLGPFEPDPWYGWSTALRRLGQEEEADHALERYHEVVAATNARLTPKEREQVQEHFKQGVAHMRANRAVEARAAFMAVLELQPRSVGALANLGAIDLSEGNIGPAREHLQGALSLQPDNEFARFQLARLLTDAGESSQAAGHLKTLLQKNPAHAEAKLLLQRLGG